MKHYPILLLMLVLPSQLWAQSDQQLARYLQQNPAADSNGDGKLSPEEARDHRQANRQARGEDPSAGDNLESVSHIPGVEIPVSVSPVIEVKLQSEDGIDLSFAYRKPAGEGPFPTILFFHGGGGQSNLQGLKNNLLKGAIQTRFVEAGYLTIASTRRPYWKSKTDNRPTGFYDAVEDAAKVVEKAKTIPGVNPNQVVLYGGSGGAILAIATASKTDLACVIAGEPATVIPLDPKTGEKASPADYRKLMENPAAEFTSDRRAAMQAWMQEINCPVLVLQGEHIGLYKTNFEILIPEMKRLKKDISSISYPGVTHGFYWGTVSTGATLETVQRIMKDTTAFIETSFRRN